MFNRLFASACRAAAPSARTFVSFARPVSRPLSRGLAFPTELAVQQQPQQLGSSLAPISAPQSILDVFNQQRRFKSRGNTYQPSMLKRKRRAGFLARLRTKGGRKILSRRRDKGRWFLTY